MKDKRKYWLKLGGVEGLGWRRLELLIRYFGSVKQVWDADPKEWLGLGVDKRVVKSFSQLRLDPKNLQGSDPCKIWVAYTDEEYPERLREIASPPVVLFFEGDASLLGRKSVAVVGTRRMSEYGRGVTREFVRGLVERGYVIVSGLASGVDGVAHETALNCKGRTLAILAHGLGMTYPKKHEDLRKRIVEGGGLVVSEYPFGVKPIPRRFVVRNRIVAGLADCVLVTESPRKSGTKITVGFAAEQGKDVYVIPGPISHQSYIGSVEIIRDGGIPVSCVDDMA